MVLGITQRAARQYVDHIDGDADNDIPENVQQVTAQENNSFRQQMSAPSPVKEEAVVDDDDALSYFARLAEE